MSINLRIFRMAVWRYFTIMFRYRLNTFFEFVSTILWGFVFLLLALVASPQTLEAATGSSNYAPFMLLGMVFQMFNSVALYGGTELLRDELYSGQIDTTFSSPFSRYAYIIANMAALAVRSMAPSTPASLSPAPAIN